MSKQIIFRSKCPSCENTNEFIKWSHPGCQNSYYYLDTFGDLTCSECHCRVGNLLEMRFKCSDHSCYRARPCGGGQLNTIVDLIEKKMDIDDDFKAELLYNIAIRYKK